MQRSVAAFGTLLLCGLVVQPIGLSRSQGSQPSAVPPAATASDFNGDGYADLLVGGSGVVGRPSEGAVYVIYGSAAGLLPGKTQTLHEGLFRRPPGDPWSFGETFVAGDFDGDGYADLAVTTRISSARSVADASQVRIVYGTASGLTTRRSQVWSQASTGVAGRPHEDDEFGAALAAADFGRGPQDDLAIGVPGNAGTGAVNVLYGTTNGLSAGDQLWSQNSRGLAGAAEDGDDFGRSLAAGRFAGGRYADLAVGVPQEMVKGVPEAGAVTIIRGAQGGLTSKGSQRWHQDSPGIRGRLNGGDFFGSALVAAPFAGRRFDDLAIGAPSWIDEPGPISDGAVNVIYGSPTGLQASGDQYFDSRTRTLAGNGDYKASFGAVLTAANFGRDEGGRRYADLVIGIDAGTVWNDTCEADCGGYGAVQVIYGAAGGLTTVGDQYLTQDSRGVPGDAKQNDGFARSLAAGDFNGDSGDRPYSDLAVGVFGEPVDSVRSGAVNVLYGSAAGLGHSAGQELNLTSLGRPSTSGSFGWVVATTR